MKLKSVNYSQLSGTPREWRLRSLTLRDVNLIVGRNATGKSKALYLTNNLAKLLSGAAKVSDFQNGDFEVCFSDSGRHMRYSLAYVEGLVTREIFEIDEKTMLTRGVGGFGQIWAAKSKADAEFQTPPTELAAVARRDEVQHKFLDALFTWGKSVYHIEFGSALGRMMLPLLVKDYGVPFDPRDMTHAARHFREGEKRYSEPFKNAILADMAQLNYPIEAVGLHPPQNVVVSGPLPGELMTFFVKERSLLADTEQTEMSQGMFRALALIIHLNFVAFSREPSCILIDDIGEGLDFERSCALIRLIIQKASTVPVQILMSTNDRFVMNSVPLEDWSILRREGSIVTVTNFDNSKKLFEDFRFTGLSNFDLLATDFLQQQGGQ